MENSKGRDVNWAEWEEDMELLQRLPRRIRDHILFKSGTSLEVRTVWEAYLLIGEHETLHELQKYERNEQRRALTEGMGRAMMETKR